MWMRLSKETGCNKEVKGHTLDSEKPSFKGKYRGRQANKEGAKIRVSFSAII